MQRIHRVAVLIETSREYGRGLLQGVIRFRQENPDWSIYFQQQDLGAALPKWLTSWRGDGILARVTDQSAAKQLLATKVPLIDLRGGTRDLGIPLFGIDNQSVAVHAFNHLKACGLQHFAFVGEPIGQHVYDDVRREAFSRLVKEQGDPCHVFKTRSSNRHANWDEHQQRLAQWLKQLPQPVGIMCCHDDRGQQVLDACQRANLGVPDEVAVIGVDNDEFLCKLSIPSLTSVDVRSERIGYQAAKLLHEVMNGEATFDQPVLFNAAGVVVRQSTDVITCGDPEITKAMRFIRQNACNQLSVDDVQRHVILSRSVLNRRFKKLIGHPPKQEIQRVQLETAKQLLNNSSRSVQEIAHQCGFNESWYFISVFRKQMGVTPATYRKNLGKTN